MQSTAQKLVNKLVVCISYSNLLLTRLNPDTAAYAQDVHIMHRPAVAAGASWCGWCWMHTPLALATLAYMMTVTAFWQCMKTKATAAQHSAHSRTTHVRLGQTHNLSKLSLIYSISNDCQQFMTSTEYTGPMYTYCTWINQVRSVSDSQMKAPRRSVAQGSQSQTSTLAWTQLHQLRTQCDDHMSNCTSWPSGHQIGHSHPLLQWACCRPLQG